MTEDQRSTTTHRDAPDWEALARYLAGESPREESRAVEAWLAAHPADASVLAAVDVAAGGAGPAGRPTGVDVEAALAAVRARIAAEEAAGVHPIGGRVGKVLQGAPRRRRDWRVAIAAAVAGVAVMYALRSTQRESVYDHPVFATPVGTLDTVALPDSSRIILAPESRMRLEGRYGEHVREVTLLQGRVFVSATHDDDRPFIVRARGAVVRDIGTEFTVDAGTTGDSTVTVVVTQGAVALSRAISRDSGVVLRERDRATLAPDGALAVERAAADSDAVAWTQRRLVFRAAPMTQVRAELRRWYGLDLEVHPSLADRRLTATFTDESAEQVVGVIAVALGVGVERAGDVVRLRPAPAATRVP